MCIQNIIKNIKILDDLNLKNKTFVGILNINCLNNSLNLMNYLPENRREYAKKLKNKISKTQTIAADLILIYLLDKFFNIKNASILNNNFIYSGGNKIYFNKSHSKNLAICAVSNKSIGVDIQHHKNLKFQEKIAQRYFSKNEINLIKEKRDFFDMWAKREAKAKLFGKGISHLNKISSSNINFVNYKQIKGYSICIAQILEL